jgi:lipopolysaccharide transport protein LptA
MLKTVIGCLGAIAATMCTAGLASPLGDTAFDTISVGADEAYEDTEPDILHLRGHFFMRSNEWELFSNKATVYGQVDKPDKLRLEGSPAHIQITQSNTGPVTASAPDMVYERASSTLKLSGGAVLKLEKETIRSAWIVFNIDNNHYLAGGAGGVTIEVPASN